MKIIKPEEMERIQAFANIVYLRAIVYCKGVAKDSDELSRLINQELINNCQKIASAIFYYEVEKRLKFSTDETILIIDEIINYSEFNLYEAPNDVVQELGLFVRLGVDEKVRFLTGRVVETVTNSEVL